MNCDDNFNKFSRIRGIIKNPPHSYEAKYVLTYYYFILK